MPVGVERLEVVARRIDLDAIVWRGNRDIPTEQQGLKILGCPVGLPDRHSVLLDRISLVDDLQSAWLLLVFCAAARANFFLRSVTPGETSAFASRHDDPSERARVVKDGSNVAVTVRRFGLQQQGG